MIIARDYRINDKSVCLTVDISIPRFRSFALAYCRPLSRREQNYINWQHDREMERIQEKLDLAELRDIR